VVDDEAGGVADAPGAGSRAIAVACEHEEVRVGSGGDDLLLRRLDCGVMTAAAVSPGKDDAVRARTGESRLKRGAR
jgi:hypothetical protein